MVQSKSQTENVPRVWVETGHAEWRLAMALWQIDGVLITGAFVQTLGSIEIDDVDLVREERTEWFDRPPGR